MPIHTTKTERIRIICMTSLCFLQNTQFVDVFNAKIKHTFYSEETQLDLIGGFPILQGKPYSMRK